MDQYYYQQPRMTLQLPRITWGVQRLILLNVGVFALQLLLKPLGVLTGMSGAMLDCFGFQPPWFFFGFIWTPITYQFLHGGLMHLFMNMLWLFMFGPDVERLLGTRRFIFFYIACGAFGVLATLGPYLLGGQYAPVIGASGAAMGVLVAYAMIDPQRQFYMFPLPVPITTVWLVILVVLFNLVTLRAEVTNVSVATHFGGMLAGYCLMKAIPLYHRWRYQGGRIRLYDPENNTRTSDFVAERLREAVDKIFRKRSN
jgi:membrane associated rhomboid family serine protease